MILNVATMQRESRRILSCVSSKPLVFGEIASEKKYIQGCLPHDIQSPTSAFEDSFHNCVRGLANIAASSIQILPESDRFYSIASHLVHFLARLFLQLEIISDDISL